MRDGVAVEHHSALWAGLTVAQLKARFYLDYVHPTDDDGVLGFLGACEFGSPNYEMHNTTRIGTLKVMKEATPGNWKEYRIFMDAGLNTKSKASITQVKAGHANLIKLVTAYLSAWFDGSSEWGHEWHDGDGIWKRVVQNTTFLPQQQSATPTEYIYPPFETGRVIYIRPYIINPEGTYPGQQVAISTGDAVTAILAQKRDSACTASAINVSIWMLSAKVADLQNLTDIAQSTGIYGYQDDEFANPLPTGFYWGIKENHALYVNAGEFQQAIYCEPPAPTKDFNIYVLAEMDEWGNETKWARAVLTEAKAETVTITGAIVSFNSSDQQIGGGSGDGSFVITIAAGDLVGVQATDYQPPSGAAYTKALVYSTAPSGLTYNSYPG